MPLFGLVGSGGFGREVMPIAKKMLSSQIPKDEYRLVFVDDFISSKNINGYDVLTTKEFLSISSEKYFNISISNSKLRKKISEELVSHGLSSFSIFDNSFDLSCNEIGQGAIFCSYSIVTANAKIGKFFHANLFSYVAHDCTIGNYVTFAPNVHCNGGVIIEDHAYIGTGAIIKQSTKEKVIVIGEGATIGMGAVVTKSVPPFSTVVGNPARIIKQQLEKCVHIEIP